MHKYFLSCFTQIFRDKRSNQNSWKWEQMQSLSKVSTSFPTYLLQYGDKYDISVENWQFKRTNKCPVATQVLHLQKRGETSDSTCFTRWWGEMHREVIKFLIHLWKQHRRKHGLCFQKFTSSFNYWHLDDLRLTGNPEVKKLKAMFLSKAIYTWMFSAVFKCLISILS